MNKIYFDRKNTSFALGISGCLPRTSAFANVIRLASKSSSSFGYRQSIHVNNGLASKIAKPP